MKKSYINTLVKKHFEKDNNKKMEIILKANISKNRNDVKKIFKKLMGYIRDKLEPANQKYYYLQVLKILNNNGYKTISKDELRNELVLYRQKIFNNQRMEKKKYFHQMKQIKIKMKIIIKIQIKYLLIY